MLIVNDDHLHTADISSLEERCHYCSKPLAAYPLIMSDETERMVYHTACAIQFACDIMTDAFTFFCPPHPYTRLFTLTEYPAVPDQEGGSHAVRKS
jgi:hypothetical protein